jgi:hypothetical protein
MVFNLIGLPLFGDILKKVLLTLMLGFFSASAVAMCRNPAPTAQPFTVPSGHSCPSGYSQSGDLCAPIGTAAFAFVVPQGQNCPSNYSQSGRVCAAASPSACYAFVVPGGNCPSGYSQSGQVCQSN